MLIFCPYTLDLEVDMEKVCIYFAKVTIKILYARRTIMQF